MVFAIEMFFDVAADRAVREVWRELGYKGIAVPQAESLAGTGLHLAASRRRHRIAVPQGRP